MSITVRFSPEEKTLVRDFAKMHGISISELIRKSVMEQIEDEYDLKVYEQAKREFDANPVTYTLDEVEKALNVK